MSRKRDVRGDLAGKREKRDEHRFEGETLENSTTETSGAALGGGYTNFS